ncbi:Rad21 / Rec8 like protein [Trichinella spiralis]|uniref:Rad21 / Rec8 like protein n=1 Tax=Trichinella spiralis TaxID=6334 RepID=UPI0001EFCF30|nr:Rad21 / Rec8 like protein [Trichinella spiralis]
MYNYRSNAVQVMSEQPITQRGRSGEMGAEAINMVKFVSRAIAHNIEEQLVNKYCFSVDQLMELRGKACANSILKFYPPVHAMSNYKRIMVICGPDNNGGNGLNYEPLIVYAAKPKSAIMKRLLSQAREFQIPIFETTDDIDWSHVDLIIDAVQGLHSNPPVKKPYKQIVASVIGFISIPIVSIDIPSGWHADEGPIGPDALQPEAIISLTVPKKCAEKFTGEMHILAGRFVPKTLDKQYELHLPPYSKDHDYVLLIPYSELVLLCGTCVNRTELYKSCRYCMYGSKSGVISALKLNKNRTVRQVYDKITIDVMKSVKEY